MRKARCLMPGDWPNDCRWPSARQLIQSRHPRRSSGGTPAGGSQAYSTASASNWKFAINGRGCYGRCLMVNGRRRQRLPGGLLDEKMNWNQYSGHAAGGRSPACARTQGQPVTLEYRLPPAANQPRRPIPPSAASPDAGGARDVDAENRRPAAPESHAVKLVRSLGLHMR